MKLTNSLVCGLLVIGLISAVLPPVLSGATTEGPAMFKLRLTRLTVLDRAAGGEADQATASGIVTVYGLTAGTVNLAKKLTYPTFIAKKSQTYQVKFYLDFLTTATTTLYWVALGSGPMIVGLSDNKGMSVVKNTTYRAEFSLDQAYIRAMALGTYDIVVALGPKPIENQLTGSGGMTMSTIRIRFDQ
jgi:hypothetical protein